MPGVKGSTCCNGSRQALVCGSKRENYHCSKRARRRAGRWKDGTENELEGEGPGSWSWKSKWIHFPSCWKLQHDRSPGAYDRVAPERVPCRLTCGNGWSCALQSGSRRGDCFCNPNKRDIVKRIRMIGMGLGRSSRRYGLSLRAEEFKKIKDQNQVLWLYPDSGTP